MWPSPQFPADLVTFTEEIRDRNFIFCAVTNELDDMHVVGNIWLFWWNTNVVFSKKDKKGFILTTFKQINPL